MCNLGSVPNLHMRSRTDLILRLRRDIVSQFTDICRINVKGGDGGAGCRFDARPSSPRAGRMAATAVTAATS